MRPAIPVCPDLGPLFAVVREAVLVFEMDGGVIVGWNAAAEGLFGYHATEAVGRPADFLTPPRGEHVACTGMCCLLGAAKSPRSGPVLYHEIEAVHRDGSRMLVQVTVSPYACPDTGSRFALVFARDVTAWRRLEGLMEAAEASATLGTFDVEAARGRMTLSPGLRRILGYGPERVVADVEDLLRDVHPDDRERAREAWEGVPDEGGLSSREFRFVRPDGRRLTLRRIARVIAGSDGRGVRVVGTLQDVTAARRDEAIVALQGGVLEDIAYELPLRDVLHRVVAGLAEHCGTGRALISELEGGRLRAVEAPGMPESFMALVKDGIPVGSPCDRAAAGRHPVVVTDLWAGELDAGLAETLAGFGIAAVWAMPIAAPHGQMLGVVTLLLDRPGPPNTDQANAMRSAARLAALAIERHHEREQLTRQHVALTEANVRLLKADRSKDEFLSVISHEIRNPLSLVMGYLNMLEDGVGGELSPTQRRYLGMVTRGADRMHRLVDELLDVAQIQAGVLTVRPQLAAVRPVVEEVLAAIAPRAAAAGIALESEVPASLVLSMDAMRISQVLSNLVGNAVKFTPAGGRIRVVVSTSDAAVHLEVLDTGCGIALADQTTLFERFRRCDSSLSRTGEGLGLGLSICKAIVEGHGGQIGVASRPGDGSRFWITLPRAAAAEAA